MESGPVKIQGTIQFGEDFELDFQTYQLRRAGRVLKLERIPTEILSLLVEQRTQIVTREQIAERIWGKHVFLDIDNSINGAIRKIRQVLRDDAEQPRFIQTITGKGYRFIAPVIEAEAPPAWTSGATQNSSGVDARARPVVHIPPPETNAGEAPQSRTQPKTRTRLVYVTLLALLAAALAGWLVWSRSRGPQTPTGKVMLAVLPFQNLTGDASQDYFSDGLTEEMITQLSNLAPQHLGVIARTSVMRYKNSQKSLEQIGRELGVQFVLEGSVRRDSNDVRITAQLIQTRDQTHVWARQYDRELKGLLALQGEIAREIADEIHLTLIDHKSVSGRPAVEPSNYEAYDLYLRGQYFLNKRTVAGLEEAAEFFQRAAAKDPNYARAFAGLADSYALMGGYSGHTQTEFIAKGRAAALRALQIDDSLPEAHTALALIVQNYDWDWETAEEEFRRAIQLNPNYATAHHWYAEHLMWRGRFDEALGESERARQLDPLSLIIAADNGAILYNARRYDRAIEKWRSVLEMDANFPRAQLIIAAYVEKGMFAEALAVLEKQRPTVPPAWYWSNLAYIHGRSGQSARAQRAVDELLQLSKRERIDPITIAQAYAGMKDHRNALTWLEKACAQHSNELTSLKVNPIYDPLRGDPRFQDLLRRVGLAQ